MDRLRQQMKKGVLELLVLSAVAGAPTYGYELLKALDTSSGGLICLKEGTLYPVLYRLEDDGLIVAAWRQGEGRAAPKKIYSATKKGKEALAGMRAAWDEFSACVTAMLKNSGTPEGESDEG